MPSAAILVLVAFTELRGPLEGGSDKRRRAVDVTILRPGSLRFCETAKSNLLSGTEGARRGTYL